MNRFDYVRAASVADAVQQGGSAATRFLAGGTNLVDLMKENVERPARVIDINRLPLRSIDDIDDIGDIDGEGGEGGEGDEGGDGSNGSNGRGLRLGALVTNAQTANDARVQARYPLLASAILAGASPQLRNAATNGGNLNQRTRCYYFYDTATPCNKRQPGSGCSAIGGVTRIHAILGSSEQCIATHPSDMCVALAALQAQVRVSGAQGERVIDFASYHRLPGDTPERDNCLQPGDLVTAIDLPAEGYAANHSYLKLRDRLSYAFALVSVAVGMRLEATGRIAQVRIALGGVAHRPWRVPEAEDALAGAAPSQAVFTAAAQHLTAGALGRGGNDFKIELAQRAIVRALQQAAAGTPQSQTDKRVA